MLQQTMAITAAMGPPRRVCPWRHAFCERLRPRLRSPLLHPSGVVLFGRAPPACSLRTADQLSSPARPASTTSSASSAPSPSSWCPSATASFFSTATREGCCRCGAAGGSPRSPAAATPHGGSRRMPFLSTTSMPATMVSAVATGKSEPVDESVPPADGRQGESADGIPLLSLTEVATKLKDISGPKRKPYASMYSSVVGGITLDPAAMVVPLDDHMVHRGHAVFDTATIFHGHLYELDAHIDRLLRSAFKAKLTPPFSRTVMRDILVQTVAASGCREGTVRYWLSAGTGGFALTPAECETGSFYAVVIAERNCLPPTLEGVKVITSSVPIKPPVFATMKSTNYMPNAHVQMEAQEKGAFQGIWLDQEGFVAEAANMNVLFVCDKELLLPSFANILSGCTAKRLLHLAQELISPKDPDEGILRSIKEVQITVQEGKTADEMMLVVSSYLVVPVLEWDGQPIGEGTVGPVTRALLSLLERDVLEGPSEVREAVPYRD